MAGSVLYDVATGSRVGTERALIMTLIVLGAVIIDRRALTMRNLAFAVLAVVAHRARGDSRRQLPALVRRGRRAGRGDGGAARARATSIPIRSCRSAARRRSAGLRRRHLVDKPLGLLFATALRDRGDRLVHGLSLPRSQPLCADRQSADADDHRILRRARRAARRRRSIRSGSTGRSGSMSAPASSSSCGSRASSPQAPGSTLHCARLRALRAAVSGARGDERRRSGGPGLFARARFRSR